MRQRPRVLPYDYSKFLGKVTEVFKTQGRFAKAFPIPRTVLYSRLNGTTEWTQLEMERCMHLFGEPLTAVGSYFFVRKVR